MSLIEAGRIDVTDIDELAETHEPWEMRHTQLSLGELRTRSDFVGTERVTIYIQRCNTSAMSSPAMRRRETPRPVLRFNSCVRLVERNRHCVPSPDEVDEYGLE